MRSSHHHAISTVADIRQPDAAEEPILPPITRQAIHEWLTELRSRQALKAVGVEPRISVMLEGPPGCGKTTLAHHVAARLGVPLIIVRADQLRSKYIGETGEKIAALFRALGNQQQESVTLIDEFDALASKRADERQGSDREHNAIVNSLLTRIEGNRTPLMVATNRIKAIDEAIWRRFGLRLEIPVPGEDERFAILKKYLAPWSLSDEDLDRLTAATAGASPALLKDLAHGIKRDIILSPRLNRTTDIREVVGRVIASARPHPDYDTPPLWADRATREDLYEAMSWPPMTGEVA